MKDGKLGEGFVTVFLKEADACPGGAFFSDTGGAENTGLPQIIKSGRWTEGRSKIVSGGCHSFCVICSDVFCTEPSTKTEWPSAAFTSSFGNWALGLILCSNILFRKVRTGTENHLLAHECAYEIRPSAIHLIVPWCVEWNFSAEWCCAALHFRFLLYL